MSLQVTASINAGQMSLFEEAVLRQLPRDISPDLARDWIDNSDSLRSALRAALIPLSVTTAAVPATPVSTVTVTSYSVCVDYALSLKAMIKRGKYVLRNGEIAAKNFSHSTSQGVQKINVELVHFGSYPKSDEVIACLDKMDMVPATIEWLLAFGEKYPDVQRQFPIVALGSVRAGPDNNLFVPFLYEVSNERALSLH